MLTTHTKLSILAGLCAVFGLGFTAFPADAQDKGKIVYVGIGGPTQEAFRKALFEPFQKETGIEVVEDTGLAAERVQAEVQSGHPDHRFPDHRLERLFVAACQGPPRANRLQILRSGRPQEHAGGRAAEIRGRIVFSSLGMGFSTAAFPEGKPQPAPGRISGTSRNSPASGPCPIAASSRAAGRSPRPRCWRTACPSTSSIRWTWTRAVKKLKELSPNVVWWKNTSQPGQYLASGEAVMELNSVGRTNNLIDGGVPLKYVWNGATMFGDKWIVLKGAPNYDNVMRFLAFVARPQNQAVLAKLIGYAPTNPAAYDVLDKATAARLVTYPDNFKQAFATDYEWWAANVSKWTEVCLSGLSG